MHTNSYIVGWLRILLVCIPVLLLVIRGIAVSIPWTYFESPQWSWLVIFLAFNVSFDEVRSRLSMSACILVSCPESSNVTTQDVINHLISDQYYRGLVHRASGMHLRFLFPPNFGIFFNSRLITFSNLLLGANKSSTCKCKHSEYSCTSLRRRHIV